MMAHDGEQGEAMIADISPDLLILDINLPKKGGIKIFNDFSEGNTGRPKFPVFIFTVREELGDLFDDLDVDGFIHKPVQLDLVLKQIDRILSNIQKNVIFIVADPKSPHALDLKDIFRQEGFRVFIMNSWHSFVANARMHIPNFILFEYSAYENLPSEQFIAKITELKMKLSSESTWPPWHNPPVIVYGYGGIFKREECVNAGAHLFLIEPEAHKMIYEAVREIMLKRERERRDRAFIEELKQKIGKLEHEAKSTATIKDYKYFDPLLKKEEGGTK
jgi:DNA-binding NtrC family response regulator